MADNLIAQLYIPQERKLNINELISFNFGIWKNIENSTCSNCGACLQSQSLIENSGRVLIFSLCLVDQLNTKITNLNLTNIPQTELRFENKRYVLSSAVFHHGPGFNEGHYTAVLRKVGKFYKANDATISKCPWPRNSKDLYLLFYVEK